jgi:hypothetical protein
MVVATPAKLHHALGTIPYDHFWGDPNNRPNPNLGTIERAPFLATKIYIGDVGTKGGVTEQNAIVLVTGAVRSAGSMRRAMQAPL